MNNYRAEKIEKKRKQIYKSPEITLLYLELEHSISAGSAKISPKNSSGQVSESWQEDTDITKTFQW